MWLNQFNLPLKLTASLCDIRAKTLGEMSGTSSTMLDCRLTVDEERLNASVAFLRMSSRNSAVISLVLLLLLLAVVVTVMLLPSSVAVVALDSIAAWDEQLCFDSCDWRSSARFCSAVRVPAPLPVGSFLFARHSPVKVRLTPRFWGGGEEDLTVELRIGGGGLESLELRISRGGLESMGVSGLAGDSLEGISSSLLSMTWASTLASLHKNWLILLSRMNFSIAK